jgi:hypothetical protein
LAFNAIHRLKQDGISSAILYGNGDFAHKLLHEALLHGIRITRTVDPASAPKKHDGPSALPRGGAPCPAALEEAIAAFPPSEHVYLIGTLNDIEEYKQTISDAYRRLMPDFVPRLFEPFA